jgi:hypothetical protein
VSATSRLKSEDLASTNRGTDIENKAQLAIGKHPDRRLENSGKIIANAIEVENCLTRGVQRNPRGGTTRPRVYQSAIKAEVHREIGRIARDLEGTQVEVPIDPKLNPQRQGVSHVATFPRSEHDHQATSSHLHIYESIVGTVGVQILQKGDDTLNHFVVIDLHLVVEYHPPLTLRKIESEAEALRGYLSVVVDHHAPNHQIQEDIQKVHEGNRLNLTATNQSVARGTILQPSEVLAIRVALHLHLQEEDDTVVTSIGRATPSLSGRLKALKKHLGLIALRSICLQGATMAINRVIIRAQTNKCRLHFL